MGRKEKDPRMPQSQLRRLVTTCTATVRAWLRTPAISQLSAAAAPRAVDFAQETPQWPRTPATIFTATAPTSAPGLPTTSARRRAENAEENSTTRQQDNARKEQKENSKQQTYVSFEY